MVYKLRFTIIENVLLNLLQTDVYIMHIYKIRIKKRTFTQMYSFDGLSNFF